MKWLNETYDGTTFYSSRKTSIYFTWNRRRYSKYNDIPFNIYDFKNGITTWLGGAGDLATAKKMAERLAVEGG